MVWNWEETDDWAVGIKLYAYSIGGGYYAYVNQTQDGLWEWNLFLPEKKYVAGSELDPAQGPYTDLEDAQSSIQRYYEANFKQAA